VQPKANLLPPPHSETESSFESHSARPKGDSSPPPPVISSIPEPSALLAQRLIGLVKDEWSDARDSDVLVGDEESDARINNKQQIPGKDEEGSDSEDAADRIPGPLRGDRHAGACCPF
jgi:hypothetical protein